MLKTVCRTFLAFVAFAGVASPVLAQDPNAAPPAANLPATINVFLDCYFCDFDFIRTEVPYVNWLRDQASADVHLLATSQATGGGGSEYVFNFIGLRGFANKVDTLKFVASGNATSDDRRKGYTRVIKTGLVPFLSRTAIAERLTISLSPLASGAAAPQTNAQRDPWHAWTFTISANANMSGEKSYKGLYGYYYGQASRITTKWKSIIGSDFNYDESKSIVANGNTAMDGDTTYTTIRRNWDGYASQFRALGEHWSTGVSSYVGSNSYNNQDRFYRAKAGIEYSLFPYKESTRRAFVLQYGAGVAHYDYIDTTIYFKTQETVPIHFASAILSARQPWGSLSGNLTRNALILQPFRRSTRLNGSVSVRIAKGLFLDGSGSYSWIHDQLYLRKGSTTTANVLLRQQALQTSYSYYGFFGVRYTFGSIFNNVVFPRFRGNDTF